jgi:hypothetical protein
MSCFDVTAGFAFRAGSERASCQLGEDAPALLTVPRPPLINWRAWLPRVLPGRPAEQPALSR